MIRHEVHPLPWHSPVHAAMRADRSRQVGGPSTHDDYCEVVCLGDGASRTVAVALRADAERIVRALGRLGLRLPSG